MFSYYHQSRPNHLVVLAEYRLIKRQPGRPYHPPSRRWRAQCTLTNMTAGALHLLLVLALQMRCADPLAIPQNRGGAGRRDSLDAAQTVNEKLGTFVHLRDLPRGPAVGPHKKAPQFMLDLFNAVSVPDGTSKTQQEILEGNTVRSFADKGE